MWISKYYGAGHSNKCLWLQQRIEVIAKLILVYEKRLISELLPFLVHHFMKVTIIILKSILSFFLKVKKDMTEKLLQ